MIVLIVLGFIFIIVFGFMEKKSEMLILVSLIMIFLCFGNIDKVSEAIILGNTIKMKK